MSLFRLLTRLCVSAHLKNIKLWAFWSQEEHRGHVTHVQLLTQTHKEAAKLWCAVCTGQKTLVGWCVDNTYETLAITDNVLETNVWTVSNKVLNDQFPSYPTGLTASYLRTPVRTCATKLDTHVRNLKILIHLIYILWCHLTSTPTLANTNFNIF